MVASTRTTPSGRRSADVGGTSEVLENLIVTSDGSLPTTGSVESRLGRLDLENGYPSADTIEKVFDDIDFQRACQAYLWALPLMAMQQWQSEHLTKFGAGKLDYVDYLTFQDKLGLLTANATTPYIMAFPNLTESGPLVLEIPAGPTAGGFTDFWQRPITDSGQTGPDQGAGGRYLILGPDDPDMQPDGYHVFRSPTVNIFSAHRVLEPDPTKAAQLIAGLRIYPYAQREAPPPTRHVSPAGRTWSGEQPRGLAYWEGLARIIDEEPVHERDRIMMGMLQPLGIEKSRPFRPTPRQQQILTDAAKTGEVMARSIAYQKRFEGARLWPGRHWEKSLMLAETNQEAPHHTQLDERTSWFYEAIGVSVGMMGRAVGVGQVYLETTKDCTGRWLNGGRTYRLTVPKDVPVAQFWSVTAYDNETRCFVDTGVQPDRSSRDPIATNADGSVDIFFGPVAPAGKPESNWIQTLPGKGWFTYFRFYGPTQAYFDRSWMLPDIEPAE